MTFYITNFIALFDADIIGSETVRSLVGVNHTILFLLYRQ